MQVIIVALSILLFYPNLLIKYWRLYTKNLNINCHCNGNTVIQQFKTLTSTKVSKIFHAAELILVIGKILTWFNEDNL